jgi:hypothetical protein
LTGLLIEFTWLWFIELPSLRADIVTDVLLAEGAYVGIVYGMLFVLAWLMYRGWPRTEPSWARPTTQKKARSFRRMMWAIGLGYPILSVAGVLYSILFYPALLSTNVSSIVRYFPLVGFSLSALFAALPSRGITTAPS